MEKENNKKKPPIQELKKVLIYFSLFLAFGGVMYLIFDPSEKEEATENIKGFNSKIPEPGEIKSFRDKKEAFETEKRQEKEAEKRRNLEDYAFKINGTPENLSLKAEEKAEVKKPYPVGTVASSSLAYQNITKELNTLYSPEKEDKEKEELRAKVEELTQQKETEKPENDQLVLMEKSYQLAAKYLTPGTPPQVMAEPAPSMAAKEKPEVIPVNNINENVVTQLQQDVPDSIFIQEYSRPRNFGFSTPVGSAYVVGRNTIKACLYTDQTLIFTDNSAPMVQLRLLQAMQVGNFIIPRNTMITGMAKLQGTRLNIIVNTLQYTENIIPVQLNIYDMDGQMGIYIPGNTEIRSAKEAAADMSAGLGSSVTITKNAGQQVVSDLSRSVIQAGSKYLSKKISVVKIHLKANHNVLLLSPEQ